jgi:hypothetical protein
MAAHNYPVSYGWSEHQRELPGSGNNRVDLRQRLRQLRPGKNAELSPISD